MQQNYGPPYAAGPSWYGPPAAPQATSGSGRGLAITSLVLSALALLGVIALAAWFWIAGPASTSSNTNGPLTGRLPRPVAVGMLAGGDLSRAVGNRIQQDGGDVTQMACPDTPRVAQGVVTVCHGVISGADYAVVVYFEDAQGGFTLNPL